MNRQAIILNTIVFQEQLEQGLGQADLLEFVQALGLKRLEIRSEFLRDGQEELRDIRRRADELGLALFYSANVDFLQGDRVNPDLAKYCQEAEQLGAPFLKVNIGDAGAISREVLEKWWTSFSPKMDIRLENNQDPLAARLTNCQRVMKLIHEADLPLSFIFDTANWVFVGDSPVEAAELLASVTTYLHCKNVKQEGETLQASSFFDGELDLVSLIKAFPNLEYLALEYPASLQQVETDLVQLEELYLTKNKI